MKSLIFGNSLSGPGPERLPEMAKSNDESHTDFWGEVSVVLTENGRIKRFSDYDNFVRFFLGYQLVQAAAAIRSPLTGSSS